MDDITKGMFVVFVKCAFVQPKAHSTITLEHQCEVIHFKAGFGSHETPHQLMNIMNEMSIVSFEEGILNWFYNSV